MKLFSGKKSPKGVRTLPKEEAAVLRAFSEGLGLQFWKRKEGWDNFEASECVEGVGFREIEGVCHVVSIDLCNNNLVGNLPSHLGDLKCLERLILCENTITGKIPEALSEIPKLACVMLQRNKLTGRVPDSLLYKDGLNLQFDGTWKQVTPDITFVAHPIDQVLVEVTELGYSEAQARIAYESQPIETASTQGCLDYLRNKNEVAEGKFQ
jgi:hypothetical protein